MQPATVVVRSRRRGMLVNRFPALCSEPGGKVVANRFGKAKEWETWTMEFHGDKVALRSHHGKYLTAQADGFVVADRESARGSEKWSMDNAPGSDGYIVAFKSCHGKYLCADGGHFGNIGVGNVVHADRDSCGEWEQWTISTPGDVPLCRAHVAHALGAMAASGATGTAVALAVTPGIATALGFTAEGIAAGSAAAGMMSVAAIAEGGGVAAGSTVATLQAVGTGASLAGTPLAGTICAVALPVTAVVGFAVWAGVVTNRSFLTNPLKDKPPQGKWMLGTEEGMYNVLFYEFPDEPTAVHAFDDVKTSRILFNKEHREVRCAGLNSSGIERIREKARHA
ncbi:IFI27 [Symbiodinium microadriaticum]|nr:IFI27 [Symbiodinium microadriaticum]CAE7498893.1 IFI27 [Symbiodinium sp. KB8]